MTTVEHPNASVLDSVEVPRVGALRYEFGFPTPETSRELFDEMDFQCAVQAYRWDYPAVPDAVAPARRRADADRRANEVRVVAVGAMTSSGETHGGERASFVGAAPRPAR